MQIERTEDEKHLIELKVVKVLTQEAVTLWQAGNKSATNAILSYLAIADGESLVRFYDITVTWKQPNHFSLS